MASRLITNRSAAEGGIKSVIDKTVDFGASDAAMSDEDMAKVDGGVQLLPMTAGCIVLTYNLKGVTGLKLSRAAYAGIFLGKVNKWNDPLITKDNAGAEPFPTNPSMLWSAPMEAAQPSSSPSTLAPSVRNSTRIPASTNSPIGLPGLVPRAMKG